MFLAHLWNSILINCFVMFLQSVQLTVKVWPCFPSLSKVSSHVSSNFRVVPEGSVDISPESLRISIGVSAYQMTYVGCFDLAFLTKSDTLFFLITYQI